LKGAPVEVPGVFRCSSCSKLKNLEGAPRKVGVHFLSDSNESLESLEGGPEEVGGDFSCSGNVKLVTLKGSPESVGGTFAAHDNPSLVTILGAPKDASYYNFSKCPKLIEDEQELLKHKDLIRDYLNSGLSIEDFLHKKRGTIKGKEFGF
jgi:hypothetical protein